jgi:heme A synthase
MRREGAKKRGHGGRSWLLGGLLVVSSATGCADLPRPHVDDGLALAVRTTREVRTDVPGERSTVVTGFQGFQGERPLTDAEFLAIAGEQTAQREFAWRRGAAILNQVFTTQAVLGALVLAVPLLLPTLLEDTSMPTLVGGINLSAGLVGAILTYWQANHTSPREHDEARMRGWADVYNRKRAAITKH